MYPEISEESKGPLLAAVARDAEEAEAEREEGREEDDDEAGTLLELAFVKEERGVVGVELDNPSFVATVSLF